VIEVNVKTLIVGIPNHAHGHAHVFNVVPASDLIGGILGFKVKVNDALHESP
jgi:Leu/Phe-tRNA-protein transferase